MEISNKDYEEVLDYKIKFIKDVYNNIVRIPLPTDNINDIISKQVREAIIIASILGKDLYEEFNKYELELYHIGHSLFLGNFKVDYDMEVIKDDEVE